MGFFLFSLSSDEPEVFLPKYSQTVILHAAHFRRVVNNEEEGAGCVREMNGGLKRRRRSRERVNARIKKQKGKIRNKNRQWRGGKGVSQTVIIGGKREAGQRG